MSVYIENTASMQSYEALKQLELAKSLLQERLPFANEEDTEYYAKALKAIKDAEEATRKTVPLPVKRCFEVEDTTLYECPTCGYAGISTTEESCRCCGQRLDLSDASGMKVSDDGFSGLFSDDFRPADTSEVFDWEEDDTEDDYESSWFSTEELPEEMRSEPVVLPETEKEKLKSQVERVIKHLEEFGSITPDFAYREMGIYRLGAVIYVLRNRKYQIVTEKKHSINPFGDTNTSTRYVLIHSTPDEFVEEFPDIDYSDYEGDDFIASEGEEGYTDDVMSA